MVLEGGRREAASPRAPRGDAKVPRQWQHHGPALGRDRGEAGNTRVALREGSPGLTAG